MKRKIMGGGGCEGLRISKNYNSRTISFRSSHFCNLPTIFFIISLPLPFLRLRTCPQTLYTRFDSENQHIISNFHLFFFLPIWINLVFLPPFRYFVIHGCFRYFVVHYCFRYFIILSLHA